MSTSTDGIIFYGWIFDEGTEFPWSDDDGGDLDGWWEKIGGYKPPFKIYTEDGDYVGGEKPSKERLDEYYKHLFEWRGKNPVPFDIIYYCSDRFPLHALAVSGTGRTASRGDAVAFEPKELIVFDDDVKKVKNFCEANGIKLEGDPRWYLVSWWG